jgi:hypothetical protein
MAQQQGEACGKEKQATAVAIGVEQFAAWRGGVNGSMRYGEAQ